MKRAVHLNDFIMPEYRGKNPDDYEFRNDGEIVRKDRWETGIHRIRNMLVCAGQMPDAPEFEIDEVVKEVEIMLDNLAPPVTDAETLANTEALAREFCRMGGFEAPPKDVLMRHIDPAKSPRLANCWAKAATAQEFITGIVVKDCLGFDNNKDDDNVV